MELSSSPAPLQAPTLFSYVVVLVKGGGDLGTGVAWRLRQCGFPVLVTELPRPLVVRRTVAFASAVYEGETVVEGVTARRVDDPGSALELALQGIVPVLVDPEGRYLDLVHPVVLVDAVMAKRNTGTRREAAPLVIALGPGFQPGQDCHCVVETQRGHTLGRVWYDQPAEPNTGIPGEIGGKSAERVLRAPAAGPVHARVQIGDRVRAGDLVAEVGGLPVVAPFDGILRGLVHDGLEVTAGLKIGDVDPRAKREACFTISDKSLAVGGGVIEAVLTWLNRKDKG